MNIVQLQMPILEQLRLEEALLRADTGNWCLINSGSTPAIVMGISGKPEELLNHAHLQQKPIPVIRRFSGGGTVVIDENTCFVTFIGNHCLLPTAAYPEKILQWSEEIYQPVFPNFQLLENDYVIGDRKFGGNAQYLSRHRFLHHSSLLWDYDPELMKYLTLPKRRPTYRGERSHGDFLCRLKELYPTKELLLQRIIKRIETKFPARHVSLHELEEVLVRPHRRTTEQLLQIPFSYFGISVSLF